jgi:hypothetical protein
LSAAVFFLLMYIFDLFLKEISDELNKVVNDEKFGGVVIDMDKEFSGLLLELLAKIINEMSNGLGGTRIGNVLYRFVFFLNLLEL